MPHSLPLPAPIGEPACAVCQSFLPPTLSLCSLALLVPFLFIFPSRNIPNLRKRRNSGSWPRIKLNQLVAGRAGGFAPGRHAFFSPPWVSRGFPLYGPRYSRCLTVTRAKGVPFFPSTGDNRSTTKFCNFYSFFRIRNSLYFGIFQYFCLFIYISPSIIRNLELSIVSPGCWL